MFVCKKCGICCSNVGMSPLYADLDRGNGKCRYFDEETKLCTIYETRPTKCNVDKMYDLYFKDKISRNKFYQLNYEACKKLKKQKNGGTFMYLSMLKETEKDLFLGLASALSSADNDFDEAERSMIASYCEEMGIEFSMPSITDKLVIVEKLSETSNTQSKKIIIFELIGLAMADNHYSESEIAFIKEAATKFGLGDNFVKNCEESISKYLLLQRQINVLILE